MPSVFYEKFVYPSTGNQNYFDLYVDCRSYFTACAYYQLIDQIPVRKLRAIGY
jgi:hypothetical protein